jgi:hypothetical protein
MEDYMPLRLCTLSLASLLAVTAAPPTLINTCLITNDVARLVEFYREALRIPPKTSSPEYAEFPTGVGVLAIFRRKLTNSTSLIPRNRPAIGARS